MHWEADSVWTIRTFNEALSREGRRPETVVHDHGTSFLGQFERQFRVLEIERRRIPVVLPFVNGTAERAIKSVRLEMLNHTVSEMSVPRRVPCLLQRASGAPGHRRADAGGVQPGLAGRRGDQPR
jgi:hypothetical protein